MYQSTDYIIYFLDCNQQSDGNLVRIIYCIITALRCKEFIMLNDIYI